MKDKDVQLALSIIAVAIGATFVLAAALFRLVTSTCRKLLDRPH